MSEPSSKAAQALEALGKYFGVIYKSQQGAGGLTDEVIEDYKTALKENNKEHMVQFFKDDVRRMRTFDLAFGKQTTIPTLKALLDCALDQPQGDVQFVSQRWSSMFDVIPFDATARDDGAAPEESKILVRNTKDYLEYGFPQGAYEPKGAFYTVKDDIWPSPEDPEAPVLPVHAFCAYGITSAPNDNETPITTFLLNSVPNIEWSRSVPFLEVILAAGEKRIPLAYEHAVGNTTEAGTGVPLRDTPWALSETARKAQESAGLEVQNNSVFGSMEVFTTPQTMIDVDQFIGANGNRMGDPFRPLATIEQFNVDSNSMMNRGANTIGLNGAGLARDKNASMRITVHSQALLNEVAPLVRPDQFGHTKIIVKFGWSHPDRLRTERPSDANYSARYGDIISECITSETFTVSSCRMSFTESGEAQIDVGLTDVGLVNTLGLSTINHAGGVATTSDLRKEIAGAIDFYSMNRSLLDPGAKSASSFSQQLFLQKLEQNDAISRTGVDKLAEYKQKLKESIGTGQIGSNDGAGLDSLRDLFNEVFGEKNGESFTKAAAQSNPTNTTQNILREFEKTADPFLTCQWPKKHKSADNYSPKASAWMKLREKSPRLNSSDYVSFGKIFMFFVGQVLKTQTDYHEAQVIFHPFNESAGAQFMNTVANFPIKYKDFKGFFKELVKTHGVISIDALISSVVYEFITTGDSPAYGLAGKKMKTGKMRDDALKMIYGYDLESSSTVAEIFKLPQIELVTHVAPRRDSILEEAQSQDGSAQKKLIMRIHVVDRTASSLSFVGDVIKAMSGMRALAQPHRSTSALQEVGIPELAVGGKHVPHDLNLAIQEGLCSTANIIYVAATTDDALNDLLEKVNEGANDNAVEKSKLEEILKSYYFVRSGEAEQKAIRKLMSSGDRPYIKYGIEGTAIQSLTVQTSQDSREVTLQLQDKRTPEQKAADKKAGRNRMDMSVAPVELDMTCMGMPTLAIGNLFFVDLYTNTNLDQVYRVTSVAHTLTPGNFETKAKLVPAIDSTPTYSSPTGDIAKFVIGQLPRE